MVRSTKVTQHKDPRKNGPQRKGPRKLFSTKGIPGNLNDFLGRLRYIWRQVLVMDLLSIIDEKKLIFKWRKSKFAVFLYSFPLFSADLSEKALKAWL